MIKKKVLQIIRILHFKSFEVKLNKDQFWLQFLITHLLLDGFKRFGILYTSHMNLFMVLLWYLFVILQPHCPFAFIRRVSKQ